MPSIVAALGLVFTRIGVAIMLKLMLGGDDFVFLAPFMARARQWRLKLGMGAKYLISVVFLTLLACAIAESINVAADRMTDASLVDKIISSVAASLLIMYATYMAWEEGWCGQKEKSIIQKATMYGSFGGEEEPPTADINIVEKEEELSPLKKGIVNFLLNLDKFLNMVCCVREEETKSTPTNPDDQGVIVVAFFGLDG
mmetsp:Transcript_10253/g.12672  ORF Transcript_10253/g.12672 Transcript_10253/m.12672 type:complete len:199 (+) Transcript_10253:38-634(+)